MDAARYGINITLVVDCLGYGEKERHDLAIKRLVDIMDASVMTSDQFIAAIGGRTTAPPKNKEPLHDYKTPNADYDPTAGMLEVASSDEDDDDDDDYSPSVLASPYMSHRPLENGGSRPEGKNLQALDTGSENRPAAQYLRLQRDAPA